MTGGPSHLVAKALITATGSTTTKSVPDWMASIVAAAGGGVNQIGSQLPAAGVISAAQFVTLMTEAIASLPTTLPAGPGQLWNNGGVLSIS